MQECQNGSSLSNYLSRPGIPKIGEDGKKWVILPQKRPPASPPGFQNLLPALKTPGAFSSFSGNNFEVPESNTVQQKPGVTQGLF